MGLAFIVPLTAYEQYIRVCFGSSLLAPAGSWHSLFETACSSLPTKSLFHPQPGSALN